ncbi:MAG: hypothetical protein LC624_00455 [Halobacteriales archaeon]|nr:hypothetical protein [Halobacteriales archaeon]
MVPLPRRTLIVALVALALLGPAYALSPPGVAADADCTGSERADVEDFAPLRVAGQSGVFIDDAFSCYQLAPLPQFGFHGHIRTQLVNLDTGDVAQADADCPLVNVGALPAPTPLDCVYSSFPTPMPHGRFQLLVDVSGSGLVSMPVGSWDAKVYMDP